MVYNLYTKKILKYDHSVVDTHVAVDNCNEYNINDIIIAGGKDACILIHTIKRVQFMVVPAVEDT